MVAHIPLISQRRFPSFAALHRLGVIKHSCECHLYSAESLEPCEIIIFSSHYTLLLFPVKVFNGAKVTMSNIEVDVITGQVVATDALIHTLDW